MVTLAIVVILNTYLYQQRSIKEFVSYAGEVKRSALPSLVPRPIFFFRREGKIGPDCACAKMPRHSRASAYYITT